jgi:hypothetical protein
MSRGEDKMTHLVERLDYLLTDKTLEGKVRDFYNLPLDQQGQIQKGELMNNIISEYGLTKREFTELYVLFNYKK